MLLERGPELFALRRLRHLRQRREDFLLCVINILQRVMEQVVKRLGFLRHRGAPLLRIAASVVRLTAQRMPGTLVPHAENGGRLLGPAPSCSLWPLEAPMAKPLPLPVWDRQRGTLLEEWMDDHQPHYESQPQRSFTQWVKSQPIYDRLYARL